MSTNNLFTVWLFGLISGFTLMLSGNSLNYWLAAENIDLRTIGFFAFISLPYAINFLWAPFFDTRSLGKLTKTLGLRLSWLFPVQLLLAIFVFSLSLFDPKSNMFYFAATGFAISFLSAAQDTILGALRTEIISKDDHGNVSGFYIFGYRIGMLISGFGAVYCSSFTSWSMIYKVFALSILLFPVIIYFTLRNYRENILGFKNTKLLANHMDFQDISTENIIVQQKAAIFDRSRQNMNLPLLIKNILAPVGSFKYVTIVILLLILYRLPDNFIYIMLNPFLLHIGYNAKQIATTGKFFGIITAIIGGLIAGSVMKKKPIIDSMLIFGILHAVAHCLFIVQEIYGKNLAIFFIATGFESITGGMAMAAYIGFIASLCHGKFRATQYSFFSSMMGLSRSIFPALSGYIVMDFGWVSFFAFTTIATIPSLVILYFMKSKKL